MIALVWLIKFVTVYQLEHIAAILLDYLQPIVVEQTPVNVDHYTEWLTLTIITLILLILRQRVLAVSKKQYIHCLNNVVYGVPTYVYIMLHL